MGYSISIVLRDVKFKKEKEKEFWKIMKEMDQTQDWSWVGNGFSKNDYVYDCLEEWRYEVEEDDTYFKITYFNGENLGDDKKLFIKLAPILEDCEIVFYGPEENDWKYQITNHKLEEIYREEF